MKRFTAIALATAMALSLTACGSNIGDIELSAEQNGLYIENDGTVTYGICTSFDKDYFDEDKLEEEVKAEIEEYNQGDTASVPDAITFDSLDLDDGVITLVTNFATDYDLVSYCKQYNQYSGDEFYVGNIGGCTADIKGDFVSAEDESVVKGKDIKKMSDMIVVVSDVYKVQIDGQILYTNNCTIDDGIITTASSENGKSFIVYKLDE